MLRVAFTIMVLVGESVALGVPVLLLSLVSSNPRIYDWGARWWSRSVLWACGARLQVEGKEHLANLGPAFLLGNHQSALDIPILVVLMGGRVRFLAKKSLFRVPLFGAVIRRCGNVPIDRANVRATRTSLTEGLAALEGRSLSLAAFPEGTRSEDGGLLPFRRGTLKVCQEAGLPIVPVVIDGSRAVLRRGRWRLHPGLVRIIVSPAIAAADVRSLSPNELHDRVRAAIAAHIPASSAAATEAEATAEAKTIEEAAAAKAAATEKATKADRESAAPQDISPNAGASKTESAKA
jgi:1-acyl-sn-glycerol-3-phosphate acyltransferase